MYIHLKLVSLHSAGKKRTHRGHVSFYLCNTNILAPEVDCTLEGPIFFFFSLAMKG